MDNEQIFMPQQNAGEQNEMNTPFSPDGDTVQGFADNVIPFPVQNFYPPDGGAENPFSEDEAAALAIFSEEQAAHERFTLQTSLADKTLLADAERAPYYQPLREKVLATVEYARRSGENLEVESVFKALLAEDFFEIVAGASANAEANALRRAAANTAASPGPLAGSEGTGTQNYGDMPAASFEREILRALRGELKQG